MIGTGDKILPCKGRWIAKRDGGVLPFVTGGIDTNGGYPSTIPGSNPGLVPLPLQGRIG